MSKNLNNKKLAKLAIILPVNKGSKPLTSAMIESYFSDMRKRKASGLPYLSLYDSVYGRSNIPNTNITIEEQQSNKEK